MKKLVTVHNRYKEDRYGYLGRKSAGTVVLEAPDAELLLKTLAENIYNVEDKPIVLSIGAAFLYPKETLNKKLGRKLAIERMAELVFEVRTGSISFGSGDFVYIDLTSNDEVFKVRYHVAVKVNKDRKARVVGVHTRSWE